MTDLSSKQRAFLRSLANRIKPVLQVGNGGVTEAFLTSLDEVFTHRELIKVKVLEGAPATARESGDQIAEQRPGVHVAQTIGRTLVLYRTHPDNPEIKLPK